MTPPTSATHDAPPDTDTWDDWYGGATPAEVAEVYRARGGYWGRRPGRVGCGFP